MNPYSEEWRIIAERASREMDPKKLAALINQLCGAFDERDRRRRENCGSATVVTSPANRENSGLCVESSV